MNGLEFLRQLDKFGDVPREWVLVKEATTSEKFGKPPWERSVGDLKQLGVINLDKPPGPTSHEVTAWVKAMLGIDRAGHAGTLEPRHAVGKPQDLRNPSNSVRFSDKTA
ncbi:MAG: tRNA pseudouridine synthase A [Desulfurococcales archaeon]|nr:tRNA pseudouridine synthase A [Desulfurococcales archaeon]